MNTRSITAMAIAATLLATTLAGCGATAPTVGRDNLAGQYGTTGSEPRFEARVYHGTPDHGSILFKLHTADLLYKSGSGGPPYHANVRVTYAAYADHAMRQLIDSASTLVHDQSDAPQEEMELLGTLELRHYDEQHVMLLIIAHDLHRETTAEVLLSLDGVPAGIRSSFLPVSATTGRPLFDDHVPPGTRIALRCERYMGDTLQGEWYRGTGGLPSPVFSTGTAGSPPAMPDSTFTVVVGADGSLPFTAGDGGFYHFRPAHGSDDGYTLFVLNDAYPEVRSADDMLPPLRYITSMQEFDQITHATDQRKAIERFWIDAAGDRDRARDAIRAFYRRVESANRHFTARVEGWKSDRGLVHIIFGTPNLVRRGENSETWVYGEETNLMSLSFTFVERTDPFTVNDMVLERDPVYKAAWYRNVESWRNGRVYQN